MVGHRGLGLIGQFLCWEVGYLLEKLHKPLLIEIRFLGGYLFLAHHTLEPILTLLTNIPGLHVVNDADVVVVVGYQARLNALILGPEVRILGLLGPFYLNKEQAIIDEVKIFEEQCIFSDNIP